MYRGTEALSVGTGGISVRDPFLCQSSHSSGTFVSIISVPAATELLSPVTVSPVLGQSQKNHVIAQEVRPAQGTAPASPGPGSPALGDPGSQLLVALDPRKLSSFPSLP